MRVPVVATGPYGHDGCSSSALASFKSTVSKIVSVAGGLVRHTVRLARYQKGGDPMSSGSRVESTQPGVRSLPESNLDGGA